jgi:THO complex subunit 2
MDSKPTEYIEHNPFRELLFRWYKELNTALRPCLNGIEWMYIRNAITVLKGVIDFFPAINFMADKFLEQLKTITEREAASKNALKSKHGYCVDLSVTAQTTYSELQKRKSKWILVQAFRPGLPVSSSTWISRRLDTDCMQKSEAKDEARAAPANSSLRASAAEFKPNGARVPPSTEVEDGEVKDNRAGNRPAGGREPNVPKPLTPREPARDANAAASNPGPQTTNPGRSITPKPASTPVSTPEPRQEPSK